MILHSDRGSQFTSNAFRTTLTKQRAVQSMSGAGRCYDNARTLKKEKLIPLQKPYEGCINIQVVYLYKQNNIYDFLQ